MRIQEVLAAKPIQSVATIRPDATVRELVGRLAEHNVGALVVSSNGSDVLGMVSERDVVRRLNRDPDVLDATVTSIMSTTVHTADPRDHLSGVMALMTEQRVRHVPVMRDGRLSGIISIGDVVKSRMGELEFERDQLDHFVHSQQT